MIGKGGKIGRGRVAPPIKEGDWGSVRRAIDRLSTIVLGSEATPTFAGLTLGNTGLHLLDTDASHDLILKPGSDLSADRTLTLTTGDAARTITLSGDPTLDNWFDQSVKVTASPTFAGLTANEIHTPNLDLGDPGPAVLTGYEGGYINYQGVDDTQTLMWNVGQDGLFHLTNSEGIKLTEGNHNIILDAHTAANRLTVTASAGLHITGGSLTTDATGFNLGSKRLTTTGYVTVGRLNIPSYGYLTIEGTSSANYMNFNGTADILTLKNVGLDFSDVNATGTLRWTGTTNKLTTDFDIDLGAQNLACADINATNVNTVDVIASGDIRVLSDTGKLEIGALEGGDLQLFHDGTNSNIINLTGRVDFNNAGREWRWEYDATNYLSLFMLSDGGPQWILNNTDLTASTIMLDKGSPGVVANLEKIDTIQVRSNPPDTAHGRTAYFSIERNNTADVAFATMAFNAYAWHEGSGNLTHAINGLSAGKYNALNRGSGNVTALTTLSAKAASVGTGNVTLARTFLAEGIRVNNADTIITDVVGYYSMDTTVDAGSITNAYGMVLDRQTNASALNVGIWLMGDGQGSQIQFGVNTGIGSGGDAEIYYDGTDLVIDTAVVGSGVLRFGTHAAVGAETISGYITVKDSAGNVRKLAVIS